MEATEKTCAHCGKKLRGRVDKKFCNDYCRNAFNNKQNSDPNNYVRNINNSLRKNRRILETALPPEGMVKLPKKKLFDQGYNFKFHTHQYVNRKGDIYYFCYEYGFLPLDGDWVLVVKKLEK